MMKTLKVLSMLVLAGTLSSAVVGCGGGRMTTRDAISLLDSPEPGDRRQAADSLRGGKSVSFKKSVVPYEAIQPLINTLGHESDPKVRGAILITLGASGAPEAKAPIDEWVQKASSREEQRWYGRALKYYLIKTGVKDEGEKFPEGWPYGTNGYPPVIDD
ncbi:MAG: HEAT repeat domain-containing protein [Polyangiaceae bacterium]